MTEQPQYYDGQIVNGWRYDKATNSWVRPAVDLESPSWAFTEPVRPKPKRYGLWILAGIGALIAGTIFLSVVGALVGGFADSTPQAQPAPAAPVQPAPVAPAPAPEPDTSDIGRILLNAAWDNQGLSGQQAICEGWTTLGTAFQEEALDSFDEVVASGNITRSEIRDFFNEKCF